MRNLLKSATLSFCLGVFFVVTGCGGGSNSSGGAPTPPPTPPTPAALTVTSISPATIAAGTSAATLMVNGTGFTTATTVQVNGTTEPTTYVSSTQVTASVAAGQLASGALLTVVAANGTTMSSSATTVRLEVDNPLPAISQVAPNTLLTGLGSTVVTVTGTGFVPSTTVQIAGAARTTTYVSATQLTVQLTAADTTTAGSLSLTAVNSAPMGGSSAAAAIAVNAANNPAPGSVIALTPTVIATGNVAATVTITGTGFVPASVAQVNGAARVTTYVSATQLTFQVTAADRVAATSFLVTVLTPAPGGGTSLPRTLLVGAATATPVITSISPASLVVGSGDTYINVYGANLYSGTFSTSPQPQVAGTVFWNGTALRTFLLPPLFGNVPTASLQATVPAALLTATGTASITVSVPTASPALSNALNVTITNPPPPTLTSISPNNGPINTDTAVTLYGTGFTAGSTVAFNGTNLKVTANSPTSLAVTLLASSVVLPGNGTFTVTTPALGGGTAAGLTYTAYIGIVNNSMVYNPVNGLFYVSVPSSVGAPYGNSVVSVDPATGALGTPIFAGSEPNKLAITSDGRYLWVGLDGASAVRKVDLTAGIAGLQFTLGGNGGLFQSPGTALALAALPGATDSVVVSATNVGLAIFDSGVRRGAVPTNYYSVSLPSALLVDGTRNEVYGGLPNYYTTYTYDSTGLTSKASSTAGSYTSYSGDEMQITGGQLYTDTGGVYDPESGSLLGTFYSSGTNKATGPTTADTALSKAFVLDSGANSFSSPDQIQVFSTSTYNLSGGLAIPVNIALTNSYNSSGSPSRLTRWGTNGLAFRAASGVYSLRSNQVKDLSGVSADLGVTLSATGAAKGSNTTYVATVTNAGPSAATNATLAAFVPSTGLLVSAMPSSGSCSTVNAVTCDLGGLANGASATVTLIVKQTAAGSATLMAAASASENDADMTNNQATTALTIVGSTYNLTPAIGSLTPAAIRTGATDTVITVNGTNFNASSTVLWNGSTLQTTYVTPTQLSATVPTTYLGALGWGAITVSNPAPGGGISAPVPLSVFQVLIDGINHILYNPYDRKLYASVGAGSSSVTGNSIAAITPETGTVGTPVNIGSQPTKMALSDDGNILYTLLGGANSIARFKMSTQQADFTVSIVNPSSINASIGYRDVAVEPGTDDTIALDFGYTGGLGLVDFNPVARTAALRGANGTSLYTGTSLQFLNSQTLLLYNSDTSQTLDKYPVTSAGFGSNITHTGSTLFHFSPFKLRGNVAFANAGGVADASQSPAVQIGSFPALAGYGQIVEPDPSLAQTFFLKGTLANSYNSNPDGITAYDQNTFLLRSTLPLGLPTVEGNTSYSGVDLVRWGQDGLAALTSSGNLYLVRGPFVVPQLLSTNTAAVLTASSATVVAQGTGNTILTLSGSNFVPGVAVTWNGGYRTTTIVDGTHVTVAIPAADFAAAGAGTLVATNPGAPASGALSVTVQ